MRLALFATSLILFAAPAAAQGIGWVIYYPGKPPSVSNPTPVLPNGANFLTPQTGTGPLTFPWGTPPSGFWFRKGMDCVIVLDGKSQGELLGYFDWNSVIDHDGNPYTPPLPGGWAVLADGSPGGYWLR